MIRHLYVAFSPTPLLLFVLLLVYMGTREGWGAWAAAPMILPVVVYSAAYGVYGIWLTAKDESVRWRALLATSAVLSGSVAIWLLLQGLAHMF